MTSALDEKMAIFQLFFSRVGLRTYHHPCTVQSLSTFYEVSLVQRSSRVSELQGSPDTAPF